MALAGVMTAKLMPETGLVPAILLAVAASVLVGCIAGFFVGVLDLQAMVITLGLMLESVERLRYYAMAEISILLINWEM